MLKLFECRLCRTHCQAADWFCETCRRQLGEELHSRQTPFDQLHGIPLVSFGDYKGAYARLLRTAKSQPAGRLGVELHANLRALVEHWSAELAPLRCAAIVPVPSHPFRVLMQTDLSRVLALELARTLKIPVLTDLLRMSHRSVWLGESLQKTLKRRERLSPERAARFRLRSRRTAATTNAPLLLVDDICATGASLMSCRRILCASGFDVKAAVVFARSKAKL